MRHWEPWFSLLAASGLVVMLVGEGWGDLAGFAIAVSPLVYGLAAWFRRRSAP